MTNEVVVSTGLSLNRLLSLDMHFVSSRAGMQTYLWFADAHPSHINENGGSSPSPNFDRFNNVQHPLLVRHSPWILSVEIHQTLLFLV